jgi:hypothetical protein
MGSTSNSSTLRNGGRPLRLAYPIYGKNTFRPSGNPDRHLPEWKKESSLDYVRRSLGLDTRAGMNAWDRWIGNENRGPKGFASKQQCEYWDRIRFLQNKSPRARKRAEQREAQRSANPKA